MKKTLYLLFQEINQNIHWQASHPSFTFQKFLTSFPVSTYYNVPLKKTYHNKCYCLPITTNLAKQPPQYNQPIYFCHIFYNREIEDLGKISSPLDSCGTKVPSCKVIVALERWYAFELNSLYMLENEMNSNWFSTSMTLIMISSKSKFVFWPLWFS